ncbi:UPF0488 protein CG14286 [Cephus cinctus]|uniref:UPF0488 protein CG14286 n=1 Tax=Cephus cinctus TaxID=211228 RepID=A0AAJ7C7E5_CEPCN|nr:UPF0488 protein CG14286 [Cephus cinctus]
MPPKYKPGGKAFPVRGKPRALPPQVPSSIPSSSSSASSATSTASGLDLEAENQFELELCWCIQQLQIELASGKLPEKQMHDMDKIVNILKSNSAPIVKKRQVMRNTFGNYREKMAQDEKKFRKQVSNVKFTNSTDAEMKSVFLRKASAVDKVSTEHDEGTVVYPEKTPKLQIKGLSSVDSTESSFKFNFKAPEV